MNRTADSVNMPYSQIEEGLIIIARNNDTGYYAFGRVTSDDIRGTSVRIPPNSELLSNIPTDDVGECEALLKSICEPWDVGRPWRGGEQWYDLPGGQAAMLLTYRHYINGRFDWDHEQFWELIKELPPEEIQRHPGVDKMIALGKTGQDDT